MSETREVHVKYLADLDQKNWTVLSGSLLAERHKIPNEVSDFREQVIEVYREAIDVRFTAGVAAVFTQARREIVETMTALEAYATLPPTDAENRLPTVRGKLLHVIEASARTLTPFVALARFERLSQAVKDLPELDSLKDRLEERSNELTKLRDDSSAFLESARRQLAKVSVARQRQVFSDAEASFKTSAESWEKRALWVAGFLIVAVGSTHFWSSGPPNRDGSWTLAANLGYFSARALVVSVLSFLLVICVRNYRSAKHNEVMNAHRSRALLTFDEFENASKGRPVHDAVLLHATEAVFSVQATGYAAGEPIGTTHVGELLKLVKSDGAASSGQ